MKNIKQISYIYGLFLLAILFGLTAPTALFAQTAFRYDRGYTSPSRIYPEPTYQISGAPSQQQEVSVGRLVVYCAPDKTNSVVGETVNWLSSVVGGTGSYSYAWSGTGGLIGNTRTISKVYTANQNQSALLSVSSGNQTVTAQCGSVQVGSANAGSSATAGLQIQGDISSAPGTYCYATLKRAILGDEVTWLANIASTSASTTYAWYGTDNLNGDRPFVSTTYATTGIKYATLTLTNGDNRVVLACNDAVTIEKDTKDLLAASVFSWITAPLFLIVGLILAILIGVFIAKRKKKQEEKEEEERDHVE